MKFCSRTLTLSANAKYPNTFPTAQNSATDRWLSFSSNCSCCSLSWSLEMLIHASRGLSSSILTNLWKGKNSFLVDSEPFLQLPNHHTERIPLSSLKVVPKCRSPTASRCFYVFPLFSLLLFPEEILQADPSSDTLKPDI